VRFNIAANEEKLKISFARSFVVSFYFGTLLIAFANVNKL